MSERKNRKRKIRLRIFRLICIILMIYSGIRIINWELENKRNQDIIKDVQESVKESTDVEEDYDIDFVTLYERNKDNVGWIKVRETDVEFPVVKTKDNNYYINHNYDKKYSTAGWIFMDYRNKLDGKDKNIIIYGHNRKDGSMFASLKNTLKEEWYSKDKNRIIYFYTPFERAKYEIFSIYEIIKEDYYITTDFKNNDEYYNYLDTIRSRSIYDFGVAITEQDKLLTLSTCADNNNNRIVIHAIKKTI